MCVSALYYHPMDQICCTVVTGSDKLIKASNLCPASNHTIITHACKIILKAHTYHGMMENTSKFNIELCEMTFKKKSYKAVVHVLHVHILHGHKFAHGETNCKKF